MALTQVQLDADVARRKVRSVWPAATSTYTGATTAEVYDASSGTVLGRGDSPEHCVEHAWVAAAHMLVGPKA